MDTETYSGDVQKTSSSSSQISQKTKNAFANIKGSFGRAKEKLMQNIGKADKSRDDVMEEYIDMFQGQKKFAHKLQEETKNYVHCVKNSHGAFQDLCEALLSLYTKEWVGQSAVESELHDLMNITHMYAATLHDEVMESIKKYTSKFPNIAQKISQMENKLVDYDAARHSLVRLQNSRNPEDEKIEKARERVKKTWSGFEPFQRELSEELPNLCDNRIKVFANDIRALFDAESNYHSAAAMHNQKLSRLMEELGSAAEKGTYNVARRGPSLTPPPEIFTDVRKDQTSPIEHPRELHP